MPSECFFFYVMATLAEMERGVTVERTCFGLEVAKQLGREGARAVLIKSSSFRLPLLNPWIPWPRSGKWI